MFMTWEIVAGLIIKEGLPLAISLIEKWTKNEPVTVEALNELRTAAKETALSRAKIKLLEAGIPLESERAKEILALVS